MHLIMNTIFNEEGFVLCPENHEVVQSLIQSRVNSGKAQISVTDDAVMDRRLSQDLRRMKTWLQESLDQVLDRSWVPSEVNWRSWPL